MSFSILTKLGFAVKYVFFESKFYQKGIFDQNVNLLISETQENGGLKVAPDEVGSKMARDMLCFTIETAVVGRASRSRDGGCGLESRYVRARLAVVRNVMVV